MKKKPVRTENLDLLRKSYILYVQNCYESYKKAQICYLQSTMYDDEGHFCCLGDLIELGERVEIAQKDYANAYTRWKEWEDEHKELKDADA